MGRIMGRRSLAAESAKPGNVRRDWRGRVRRLDGLSPGFRWPQSNSARSIRPGELARQLRRRVAHHPLFLWTRRSLHAHGQALSRAVVALLRGDRPQLAAQNRCPLDGETESRLCRAKPRNLAQIRYTVSGSLARGLAE